MGVGSRREFEDLAKNHVIIFHLFLSNMFSVFSKGKKKKKSGHRQKSANSSKRKEKFSKERRIR